MQSIKADYALYAGDDTSRIADFPDDALKMIAENPGLYDISVGFGILEDLKIEYGTLKKFQRQTKKELNKLLISPGLVGFNRRHPASDYQSVEPIWLGPHSRKKGFCLYYNRMRKSWIDEIAAATVHGLGIVVGNDCEPSDRLRLLRKRVNDLHSKPKIIDGVAFLGLEGSSGDIGIILYTEDEAQNHLEKQWDIVSEKDPEMVVLVSHAPPKGVLDLSRRFGINNIGSIAVKDFITTHDVNLVVCGHSHINGGRVEKIGGCIVLNIASNDYAQAPGLVAQINLERGEKTSIVVQRLFDSNWILQSIHKIGTKRSKLLNEMGIQNLNDICVENASKMIKLNGVNQNIVNRWIMEAKALEEGQAYRISDEKWQFLKLDKILIYDIETDISQTAIWCIGAWNGKKEEFIQFFQKKDEKKMLEEFFNHVNLYPNLIPVTFSATSFDQRIISTIARRHNLKLPKSFKNEVDLGGLVVHRTIGTPKGGLKQLGPFFGYEWTDPSISGAIVGMEYSNYLENGVELDWNKYLEYNRDDVLATLHSLKALLILECVELDSDFI